MYGYGQRWSVEIAFSTFKRVLGENIRARKWENVVKSKVFVYNKMIDMVTEQELARNNKDVTACKKMADAATVWEGQRERIIQA